MLFQVIDFFLFFFFFFGFGAFVTDILTRLLESLRDYFSQFGEVQECTVMRDSFSGRSRGFGFLTFRDPKTVNTVMVKEHYLDGKIVRKLLLRLSFCVWPYIIRLFLRLDVLCADFFFFFF